MIAHTLTVQEALTQMPYLITQTKQTQLPVLLTTEKTSEPIIFLVESSLFERLQKKARQLFHIQLQQLLQQLDIVEQGWENESILRNFVKTFPEQTWALWEASIESVRDLCVTLDLAARRLNLEYLKLEQIESLRYCLELMRKSIVTEQEIESCHRRLIESGLPPMMGGSDELFELYMEEEL